MRLVVASTASQIALRERAQALIQAKGAGLTSAKNANDALRVLFDLAAAPETGADALALLQEMQVNQVALDLQTDELQRSRAELAFTGTHQRQLLDASPCAQLVLDGAGRLIECNACALGVLGQNLAKALGKQLPELLPVADAASLQAWLAQAQQSRAPLPVMLDVVMPGQSARTLCAAARANPLAPGLLVAWVEAAMPDGVRH